ncbi:MAG: dihydroneopterin aldolase [Campylobacterales bacterium]|nr:dihydroneopterin aldolase [Campylobacterales bacterium]
MKIHIEELRFNCIIGLLETERHTPQEVIINLELDYDYKNEFMNYAELCADVQSNMQEKKYELLETALDALFALIYARYPLAKRLFIKITKPDILDNCRVSVSNIKKF